jgi:hypothetical protein
MKRWLTHLGIVAYLFALAIGLFGYTFKVGTNWNTLMYFVVWDMFSGWAAYEGRVEVIGEGVSGKYYELAPGPWGEFHPYGRISRHHYDVYSVNGARIARNTLEHTRHEPMARIFVIEEEYPKRFNMPDAEYEAYYNKPKDFHKYCHTRFVLTPDWEVLNVQNNWFKYQYEISIRDNPRMISDARRHQPFITDGQQIRSRGAVSSGQLYEPGSLSVESPLAN